MDDIQAHQVYNSKDGALDGTAAPQAFNTIAGALDENINRLIIILINYISFMIVILYMNA